MKAFVDKAKVAEIKVGVHILSNFIPTNDPYVTSVPDKRLEKVGASRLVDPIGIKDKSIVIEDPTYFNQKENNTYRLLDQNYFRRNYIPSMLGWFSMREGTGLEYIKNEFSLETLSENSGHPRVGLDKIRSLVWDKWDF